MNKSRTILYIGPAYGTSLQRAEAFRRLGHTVTIVDPRSFLPGGQVVETWLWRTGGLLLEGVVRRQLLAGISAGTFDLAFVDCGSLLNRSLVRELKTMTGSVVNYNIDDPFGSRDARRWRQYLQALPEYDLTVVLRACNVSEARQAGAKHVLHVTMSADEVAHRPRSTTSAEVQALASDVLFLGTWMPERGPFLANLIELGVPLALYGNRWSKAPEWPALRAYWRGPALADEDQYAKAVQCAKVCIGLLSKGNRDESTTRSFEIPLLKGVLCAERTPEHLALYRENEEAVFWSTPEECAEKCHQLLADEDWRTRLAQKGRERCLANGTTNEVVMSTILRELASGPSSSSSVTSVHTAATPNNLLGSLT